jgi:peptide/nickel transport system substrate-binding protein
MPERLATTDPFRQVKEMIWSGPYRFLPTEFNAGERAAYERFTGYLPRGGPKQALVHNRKIHA